jgi:hypothetical protein
MVLHFHSSLREARGDFSAKLTPVRDEWTQTAEVEPSGKKNMASPDDRHVLRVAL